MAMVERVVDILSRGRLSRLIARISRLEADVARQGPALEDLRSRIENLEDRHEALEGRAADADARLAHMHESNVVLETRLAFLERLLGAGADKPDGTDTQILETVLDQRLAYCESRLLAILNGSYLERVRAIAREEVSS